MQFTKTTLRSILFILGCMSPTNTAAKLRATAIHSPMNAAYYELYAILLLSYNGNCETIVSPPPYGQEPTEIRVVCTNDGGKAELETEGGTPTSLAVCQLDSEGVEDCNTIYDPAVKETMGLFDLDAYDDIGKLLIKMFDDKCHLYVTGAGQEATTTFFCDNSNANVMLVLDVAGSGNLHPRYVTVCEQQQQQQRESGIMRHVNDNGVGEGGCKTVYFPEEAFASSSDDSSQRALLVQCSCPGGWCCDDDEEGNNNNNSSRSRRSRSRSLGSCSWSGQRCSYNVECCSGYCAGYICA